MSSGAVLVVGEAALELEYPYVYAQAQFPHLLVGKRVVVAGKLHFHSVSLTTPHTCASFASRKTSIDIHDTKPCWHSTFLRVDVYGCFAPSN